MLEGTANALFEVGHNCGLVFLEMMRFSSMQFGGICTPCPASVPPHPLNPPEIPQILCTCSKYLRPILMAVHRVSLDKVAFCRHLSKKQITFALIL